MIRLFRPLPAALFAAALLAAAATSAAAASRAQVERQFRAWLAEDIWPLARAEGVPRAVFARALDGVTLDWKLPDLRPPGAPERAPHDYAQAEFRSPALYFKESRIDTLVALGRVRLERWRTTLDAIERRYGVPRRILVAIWGRESGYGRAALPHNAVRVLATQAFMGRRQAFFRAELVAALRLAAEGHIAPGAMKSSWAGALGQPQFLPSKFLQYAVDFDGDGRRDIWNSVPDALASIANYLRRNGWQPGRDWGFEAEVPAAVSCTNAGPHQGRPIADWIAAGVERVAGRVFPAAERARTGYLLMPAGRFGPAFIATENFYVLKTFNESDLYALFIGHLADRYGANKPFIASWGRFGRFSRADVQAMQRRLESRGYDVGGADGLIGFKTRVAVGLWQERSGRRATCFPDAEEVRRIG